MKMKLVVCVLLICLCIGIFAGCCSTSESDGSDYEWYIKIYMPDGVIEGPGRIAVLSTAGIVLAEVDGIQYKVGSQNILARRLTSK